MITNILPSVNPAAAAIAANGPDHSSDAAEPAARVTSSNHPLRTRAPITAMKRSDDADDSGFLHTAKHLIKDALKDFRHGVNDSLRDLGFDRGLVKTLTRGVMDAARNALRSGVDFSARLMVAAVSITSSGRTSAFSLVAHSIEININHSTGSIDIAAVDLSIEGQAVAVAGAAQPHLLDVSDSDPVAPRTLIDQLRGLPDLDEISGDDGDDEPAPGALLPIAQMHGTDGGVAAPVVDAVVEPVAETTAAGEPASEETPPADEPAQPAAPLNYVRISIAAFEQYLNDLNQQITYVRLDAFIPLVPKPADSTVAQIEAADIPEQPVEETGIALVA